MSTGLQDRTNLSFMHWKLKEKPGLLSLLLLQAAEKPVLCTGFCSNHIFKNETQTRIWTVNPACTTLRVKLEAAVNGGY